MNKSTIDDQGRRKRIIWISSFANLVVIAVLGALWFQGAFTAQIMAILILADLLIVNGALWLGWRIGEARRRKANRPLKPFLSFVIGGFSAVVATLDIASKDYGAAGIFLACSVSVILLGFITLRNAKKKDAGPSAGPPR